MQTAFMNNARATHDTLESEYGCPARGNSRECDERFFAQ